MVGTLHQTRQAGRSSLQKTMNARPQIIFKIQLNSLIYDVEILRQKTKPILYYGTSTVQYQKMLLRHYHTYYLRCDVLYDEIDSIIRLIYSFSDALPCYLFVKLNYRITTTHVVIIRQNTIFTTEVLFRLQQKKKDNRIDIKEQGFISMNYSIEQYQPKCCLSALLCLCIC